ncbi:uncharacterized protein [Hyperolius riggenbachi]|uniref:uncharacterized protein n=1 Tax=Hyperolius riggenbachi TaxID=752182 RepID=UPI0035A3C9A3
MDKIDCIRGIRSGVCKDSSFKILCNPPPKGYDCSEGTDGIDCLPTGEEGDTPGTRLSHACRLLLPCLPSQKTQRRLQVHHKSKVIEQIHLIQKISNGQYEDSSEPTTERLLYGVPRPQRCILTHPHESEITEVSEICHQDCRGECSDHNNKRSYVTSGAHDFCLHDYGLGTVSFKATPGMDPEGMEQEEVFSRRQGTDPSQGEAFFGLVEGTSTSLDRPSLELSNRMHSDNRCKCNRVGGTLQEYASPGSMVSNSKQHAIEQQRVGSSQIGSRTFLLIPPDETCVDPDRQFFSSGIPEQAGGYQECFPLESDSKDNVLGGTMDLFSKSYTFERFSKLHGRFPQSGDFVTGRVEPSPGSVSRDSAEMGQSRHRLICFQAQQQMPSVLFPLSGGQLKGHRCLLNQVGVSSGLCLSTNYSDSESTEQNNAGEGQSDIDNSFLAKKTLVFAAEKVSCRGSLDITEQTRLTISGPVLPSTADHVQANSVEPEWTLLKQKGFSEELIKTLICSRKEVTRKMYAKAWRTYSDWCSRKGVSRTLISSVLEFLQAGFAMGLSISTLKVQTAALSVFLEKKLSEDRFIIQFFHATSRLKPKQRIRTPPWDLNTVLQAFSLHPFEPLSEISEKNLTLKAVFLLAICSARRVNEIQALSIDEPYCIVSDDRITLKMDPTFLPKVVSDFHRSQEIYLPSFCPNPSNDKERKLQAVDVRRCILQYMEVTNSWRRSRAMFVLHSGPNRGRQASKATIARWLRQAISLAYSVQNKRVPASIKAHSTRSMSTSWAERAGASIEQICRAATWSSSNTFAKHYKLDVSASRDLAFGRKVLQAVIPP